MNKELEKKFDELPSDEGGLALDRLHPTDKIKLKSFIDKYFIDKEDVMPKPDDMCFTCACGKCKVPQHTMKFYTKQQVLDMVGEDDTFNLANFKELVLSKEANSVEKLTAENLVKEGIKRRNILRQEIRDKIKNL